MFVELGALGILNYGYKRLKNHDIYSMKKEIKDILVENKLDYYTITEVRRSLPWGYSIIISLNGKGFDKLEAVIPLLETKLGYTTFIQQNDNLKTATMKIICLPVTENTKFVPVKTRPFEVYYGLSYTMQELIVSLQKFPHILVSGQTGCGKTELIRLVITNIIYNFTDRDINIYFSDLSDMCDFNIFENCKQVKGYAKDIQQSEKLFSYLMHIYSKRLEIFAKNNCKNINEYNEKLFEKRMPYIIIVMDEMADYFPVKSDKDCEMKEKVYDMLRHAIRKFRKCGMFVCIGIQRPDTTVLDASLKSGLCTKIGFSQNNDASSLVVADTIDLTNIENRKALLMFGNRRDWFKSLYIDDKLIEQYIKPSIVKDRTKLNDYNIFLPKQEVKHDEKNLTEAKIKKDKRKNKKVTKISDVETKAKEEPINTKKTSNKKNDENIIPYKVRVRKDAK